MRSRIAPAGEPGEPLVIEGTVRDSTGAPAEGIVVYSYQNNQGGLYPPDNRPPGVLRGWAKTDQSGNYRFDTIRPGPYPDDDIPAHVHLHIIEPDTVTYIVDDIIFTDDPLWPGRWALDMRSGRGGDGLGDPSRDAIGVWHIRNDLVLGENIVGYDAGWTR
jgi:protocatechuate 3,4-dioxygenase beta subunit